MAISLGDLARSIAALAELDPTAEPEQALEQAAEAARTLLGTDSAGLLLANADGELEWAVGADARAQSVTAAQVRQAIGPCVAAYEESRPIHVADITTDPRWQPLRREFAASGIRACLSIPVRLAGAPTRLAGAPVGVLDLYSSEPRNWDDSQIAAAQAYAGVVRMLLGTTLSAAAASQLADQLQRALNSRVRIEQAKGALMVSQNLDEQQAWERLRTTARSSRRPVSSVAAEVLGVLTPEDPEVEVPSQEEAKP
jgi:GAF domain-containing protein